MKIGSAGLAALAIAAVIAGCGSSTSSGSGAGGSSSSSSPSTSSTPNVKVDPAVAKEVPSQYKSKPLVVASDASYPPNEFLASDGKTVEGMGADMARALAAVMGVKANVQNVTFDAIIPGLTSGKYTLGVSSITDTKAREKVLNFVTYYLAGTAFYTKAQGGTNVTGLADLCGKTVAVEKGTTQASDATAQGAKCKASGKPGVNVLTYPDQNGANLAISSGRAQVGMADSPVAAYQVKKSNGQFKLVGKVYGTAPYGIAMAKRTQLTKPLLDGLKALMKNGAYKKILTKWGIESGAISNPTINGATS